MSFVHLNCHSEFSILECPNKISDLVDRAVSCGMPALALTDNASMYGAIEFYQKAKDAGINPLVGVDFYISSTMKEKVRWNQRLILIAQSFRGYQQLIELMSKAHLDGFYYKPRLDLETIFESCSDLIAISPPGRGPVAMQLQSYQEEQAFSVAESLKQGFSDRLYLGVQRLGAPYEELVESGSVSIGEKLGIPIVAMHDIYYMNEDDAQLRDVLFCIQTGKRLYEDAAGKFHNSSLYFRSAEEMAELFSDRPEWLRETVNLAQRCDVTIEMEQVLLPHFDCPGGQSSEDYLEALVWEGIDRLYGERSPEIVQRVQFELGIIKKMQYPNYFLIIYDFLKFCQKELIPVGPGRGSAAGSIVAYALEITKCDPLKYKLLFERFLNPERVSMPDIDIDFCIKRRSEVIDYIVLKYGQDCVSQIITFGTMQARAVVRDVGRVLDVPLSEVDRIAKLIPASPGSYTSIPEAMDQVGELKQLYESNESIKELLDIGIKLEGVTRHTSTHAAGVVISRDPLTTVVPLTQNSGQVATQYAMADIERIGLLKMDILGLRNLTVIENSVSLIRQAHDESFDIDAIPTDDATTYSHLCCGHGIGVFQCESKGMRQLMKELQPSVFEDVIALLALYRPGPLGSGMVSDFVSNKLGKTEVSYDIDALEPILSETYGMIVYQEQVMQIASVIGGFSLGQADMLRRAMGKKKKDVMDKMRDDFLAGAKEKGFPEGKSRAVFELCYKFAEYGFNKSHSAAYAMISYQTAYLKANYLVEYMASLLSSVVSNSDKTSLYIQECHDQGVSVLPPDINESKHHFAVVPDPEKEGKRAIRFGLSAVKNVGDGAIESITAHAPYKDLADFCMRVDLKQTNKRVVESLIKVGAFDAFGERSYLLALYESVIDRAQVYLRERQNGQVGLFADNAVGGGFSVAELHTDDYRVYSPSEKLKMEKELLGLYISGHPLDVLRDRLEQVKTPIQSFTEEHQNKIVSVTGLLSECRRIMTRNKKEMLLGTLEDLTGSVTVLIFFDDDFEKKAALFQDDFVVTVTGRIRLNADETSVSCQDIALLERADATKSLYIDADGLDVGLLEKIRALNLEFKGTFPVYLKIGDRTVQAHQKYWVCEDDLYRNQLEAMLGKGRVWVV